MLRRILAIGGLSLAAVGLLGAPATAEPTTSSTPAATAGQSVSPQDWDACVAGYSCYYSGYNGTGSRWLAPHCGGYGPFPGLKSVRNRGHGDIYLYAYDGAEYYVPIGGTVNIYDSIESFYIEC
ncbi:peptidase inhibitor family I36 protein [Kutzneria sp. NPDC052558]|uniref:peptidase inhibitor family I36 protein n=1 Tax=Kutzneria sp. NPDC052558 TaxID=3364121 RepID=UPI0037C84E3F